MSFRALSKKGLNLLSLLNLLPSTPTGTPTYTRTSFFYHHVKLHGAPPHSLFSYIWNTTSTLFWPEIWPTVGPLICVLHWSDLKKSVMVQLLHNSVWKKQRRCGGLWRSWSSAPLYKKSPAWCISCNGGEPWKEVRYVRISYFATNKPLIFCVVSLT